MTTANKDMKNTKDADAVGIESTALFGKFYVDGQWKVIKKKCSTCCYVKHFNKRADEPSNMGCDKPGWEGYTFENDMACGGVFYFPNTCRQVRREEEKDNG